MLTGHQIFELSCLKAGIEDDRKQAHVLSTMQNFGELISLDSPLGEEGDKTYADTLVSDSPDLDHIIDTKKVIEKLLGSLKLLKGKYREVISLIYLEDLCNEEVAIRLDTSTSYVPVLHSKAIAQLRELYFRKVFV